MEPVGGMDRIVAAFMRRLGSWCSSKRRSAIRVLDRGVDVTYRKRGPDVRSADYCLNCIPMHLLAGIEHNFPRDYAAALPPSRGASSSSSVFRRRSASGARRNLRRHLLDAAGHHADLVSRARHPSPKGVMLGAYTFHSAAGEKFARLPPAERFELAISRAGDTSRLWQLRRTRCQRRLASHESHARLCGPWNEALCTQWFTRLESPVGNHYLIGDQVSFLPGWQEGAVHSAFYAIADIDARVSGGASQELHS